MNLIECLSIAPIEYLQSVSLHLGASAKLNSKSDLIHQISIRLRNPEVLQELIAGFEPETQLALRFIVYLGGIAGLPVQQCQQRLLQVSLAKNLTPEQVISPLIDYGIISSSSDKSKTIPRYYIPKDIRFLLIPILSADIQSFLQFEPTVSSVHSIHGWAIIHDTFSFLSYIRRFPPQLSNDNLLYKKTILEINHLFEIKDKPGLIKGDYPTRLRLIIYFCQSQQFISQDDSTWIINEDLILSWLNLSKLEQLKSIYTVWSKNQLSTLPFHSVMLTILAGIPVSSWVTLSSLITAANAVMPDSNWQTTYISEIKKILFPGLNQLGLIALGESKTNQEIVISLTELGKVLLAAEGKVISSESKLDAIIQPNFDILITADCPLPTRWELELFADLVRVDLMLTLHISKTSILRAFESGYTAKKIGRILHSLSTKPVPQNVGYTIEEWEKQYGRIYFADVFLLRCDHESLAKELQSSTKIKPFILDTVSGKDLIINKKQYQKLIQVLKEEGYLPKSKIPIPNIKP
ncbi:MAG: helicase-associated domain-containing protein [bacterium]